MRNKHHIVNFALSFLLLFPNILVGWTCMTHVVASEIVKSEISEKTIWRMNRIYSNPNGLIPNETDWTSSFYWFRKTVNNSMPHLDGWQTYPRPYDPEGCLSIDEENCILASYSKHSLVSSLKGAQNVLMHWKSTPWERNFMLRIFISGILDLHQPSRCVNYYSSHFKKGDNSGMIYGVAYEGRTYSLTDLWDSLFGLALADSKKYLTDENLSHAKDIAKRIKEQYPLESFDDPFSGNFQSWADESYQIAVQNIYQGIEYGTVLTPEYIERCRSIAERQLALASYRLAYLLEKLIDE